MKAAGLHSAAGRSRSSEGLAGAQATRATGTALQAPDGAVEAPPAPEPALHGAPGGGCCGAAAPPGPLEAQARCWAAGWSRTLSASAANACCAFGPTSPGEVHTGALVVCVSLGSAGVAVPGVDARAGRARGCCSASAAGAAG